MRKEVTTCDVCGKTIAQSRYPELTIIGDIDVLKLLGLTPRRYRSRRRRYHCSYIDVCSKACFVELLEKIKQGKEDTG